MAKFFHTRMSVLPRSSVLGFACVIAAAASATGADLAVAPVYKAPLAPAAAPYFNWNGFYAGVNWGAPGTATASTKQAHWAGPA